MSRPINAYAPDPNGWIDTAPSSSRRPTQRPLVSFNHGIATPLSSGYKPSSGRAGPGPGPKTSENIRKRLNDQTPITKDRQGTLNRYLYTPSTVSDKDKKRESRVPLSDKDTPVQSQRRGGLIFGNGKKQDKVKEASKLKVHDDFWDSEEEQEEILETGENRRKDEKEKRDVIDLDLPPVRQKRSGKKDDIESSGQHTKKGDHHHEKSSPRKRKSKMTEEIIPPSLPPPAQSTRSRDISPASPSQQNHPHDIQRTPVAQLTKSAYKEPSPSHSTRSRRKSASPHKTRKSPSLPPLTPSLSPDPELETEPTQPRAPSLSPGPFDRLSQHERTPPNYKASSSPLQITPVPEWVQYNHRQMNHRNQSQFDAIPSPWAKRDRAEPGHIALEAVCNPQAGDGGPNRRAKKRKREITKEEEINRRVWTAAHEKRHRTPSPDSKGKRLVDLSSSDPVHEDDENPLRSSPHETPSKKLKTGGGGNEGRKALTPMKPNALRGTISFSNIGRDPSQKSPLLITPRRRKKKGTALVSPLPRTSVMQMERERERSLSPSPIKSTSKAFPRLSGRSPSPEHLTNRIDEMEEREQLHSRLDKMNNDHRISEPPITPQRIQLSPKEYPHHRITPPKSHRPKMSERQETLFVLPDPPPRPHFPTPDRNRGADNGMREWKVAEMQPETLLDWGLEPEDGDEIENQIPEEGDADRRRLDEGRNESQSPEPPLFSPNASPERERRPSLGHRWSSKSIEPTALSQDFPRLIPSSPSTGETGSPVRSLSPPVRSNDRPLSRTEKTSQAGPSQGRSKWDHLQRGILATTPISNANASTHSQINKATPKDSQRNKKRKSNITADRNEQSKLASFGFFNDKPSRKLNREFEKPWEDEEDLDLDLDLDMPEEDREVSAHEESLRRDSEDGKGKKLGKVPEAPYHPSLRPAGIREMERRDKARLVQQSQSPKINDISSSPDHEDEQVPLFDVHHSSSLTGSSMTSSSIGKTPGSTRDWWDGLGKRRGSEFGTME